MKLRIICVVIAMLLGACTASRQSVSTEAADSLAASYNRQSLLLLRLDTVAMALTLDIDSPCIVLAGPADSAVVFTARKARATLNRQRLTVTAMRDSVASADTLALHSSAASASSGQADVKSPLPSASLLLLAAVAALLLVAIMRAKR